MCFFNALLWWHNELMLSDHFFEFHKALSLEFIVLNSLEDLSTNGFFLAVFYVVLCVLNQKKEKVKHGF